MRTHEHDVNLTMLVHNRPRLTRQSISSLIAHTRPQANLTILDDASDAETVEVLREFYGSSFQIRVIRKAKSEGTGVARNDVIANAKRVWGKGRLLYLSDNDVYFHPKWLEVMIEAFTYAQTLGFKVLGAYNHPFHMPLAQHPFYSTHLGRTIEVMEYQAVATQSWLLEWETWEKWGPFDRTPVGKVRQSEDHAFCQRLREDGWKVGALVPAMITNTSRTDSLGERVPGAELIPDVEGVWVE